MRPPNLLVAPVFSGAVRRRKSRGHADLTTDVVIDGFLQGQPFRQLLWVFGFGTKLTLEFSGGRLGGTEGLALEEPPVEATRLGSFLFYRALQRRPEGSQWSLAALAFAGPDYLGAPFGGVQRFPITGINHFWGPLRGYFSPQCPSRNRPFSHHEPYSGQCCCRALFERPATA